MAELVKTMRTAIGVVWRGGVVLLLASSTAFAQGLPDPTRPPDAMNPAAATGASATPATPVLQSVIISPGRKAAIISGKEVKLNGKFGDARVVSITETEVVLRSGKNIQKLRLFPDIDMHKSNRAKERG